MLEVKKSYEKNRRESIFRKYKRFQSSIYGQVVFIIFILSVFLLLSFRVIIRTVDKEYIESIIQQSGNNVCLLVEGSLYQHMLENDKSAIQNTLRIINKMPGIEDVNMYDSDDNLVYTSYSNVSDAHSNPNCKSCHPDIGTMFPRDEKTFRTINIDSRCSMSIKDYDNRLLLIKSPIMNEPSCYTSACHAHDRTDRVLGSFVIRIPLEELDANLNKSSILTILITLILVTFLMLFAHKKIKNPLNAILKASEAVSKGDKKTRLEIKHNQLYDMRMVSSAFNEMLDNLQSATNELQNWSQQLEYKVRKKSEELTEIQNEMIHVERIASLGKLSASVAHEINNPLAGVLTYTKLVQRQLYKSKLENKIKDSVLNYLQVIEKETKRCGEIVKGLLEFSKEAGQEFRNRHLNDIMEETFTLMAHQMKIANINFQKVFTAKMDLISCNDNQIKQACIALLLNALDAVDDNGEIMIKTSNPDNETVKIEITDNGVGIAPEDIPHIFEPFFSAKQKVSGIGLGLAIVHGIVQSHDGTIEVFSKLGKITTMSITLPLVEN